MTNSTLTSTETYTPGNIDRIIVTDNNQIRKIFGYLNGSKVDKKVLGDKLTFLIGATTYAKQQVLQPQLAESNSSHADTFLENNRRLQEILVDLSKAEGDSKEYTATLENLRVLFEKDATVVEETILPAAKTSGLDLKSLGEEYLTAKRSAPPKVHESSPEEGFLQKAAATVAKPFDMAKAKKDGSLVNAGTDISGQLDPQAQDLINKLADLGAKPIEWMDTTGARTQPNIADAVKSLAKDKNIDIPTVKETKNIEVPTTNADGHVNVRLYIPEGVTSDKPIIGYIHGGGWVIADIDTYEGSAVAVANATGAIVASVEYRHAPEHLFPAAHDDVLTAARWLALNSRDCGANGTFALLGESAGGNMAAATSLILQEENIQPVAQVLVYPVTTGSQNWDSFAEAADAVPLASATLDWFVSKVFGKTQPDERIELLDVASDKLAKLPPTLVITAERDPLRDQGQAFAKKLEEAGVQVDNRYYSGVPHEFFGCSAVLDTGKTAVQDAANFLTAAAGNQALPKTTTQETLVPSAQQRDEAQIHVV